MDTITVNPTEWREFCERFTRQHRGWPISLDKAGRPDLTVPQAKLVSVSIRGRGKSRAFAVSYRVIGEPFRQAYLLRRPRSIRLARGDDGAEQGLAVEADSGTVAISFLVTAPAEAVNGIG